MCNTRPRTIDLYQIPNGHEPFTRWFNSIRDTTVRRRIQARLIVCSGIPLSLQKGYQNRVLP